MLIIPKPQIKYRIQDQRDRIRLLPLLPFIYLKQSNVLCGKTLLSNICTLGFNLKVQFCFIIVKKRSLRNPISLLHMYLTTSQRCLKVKKVTRNLTLAKSMKCVPIVRNKCVAINQEIYTLKSIQKCIMRSVSIK